MRSLIFTLALVLFTHHYPVSALDASSLPNQPPNVSFIYPTNTLVHFSPSSSVVVRAQAADPDGSITQVRLLVNGGPVAADLQAPYEFLFTPGNFGDFTLQLEATDNSGKTNLSSTRMVQYVRIFDDLTNDVPSVYGTNLTLYSSNVDATYQKGEPQHAGVTGGKSVWFSWRATRGAGTVVMDTEGSTFDTVLAVYTNRSLANFISSPTNLVEVASNDNDPVMAPLSRVKFEALSNLTYWIAVDGRDGFAGNVKLSIQQKRTTVAPNDYIANATRVLMGTAAPVSNVGGTKEQDEPNHAGNLGGASMWFRLDISGGNPVRITTQGSTFDTLLAVYTNSFGRFQMPNVATTMRDLRFVAANDDAEGTNRTSEITILPPVSGTYWVAVDGYNGAEGNIRLNVTQSVPTSGPAPRNDRFLNAERLEGSSALTGVNTLFATTEAGEPVHRGQRSSGRSVWYRWTAPESGPVYLSTEWSSFDTWLSVFVGTNVATLQPIAFNDDANGLRTSTLLFDAVGGVEYRISVAGYQGAGGEMVLMLNQPKASVPRMITHWDGARFALSVASVSDRMLLEASSDLVDWRPIRWIGPGEEIGDLEPSANPGCEFYRVVAIE